MILDSGQRREFDSGAVRDIVEGKGRCDLLPLDILACVIDASSLTAIFGSEYVGSDLNKDLLVSILNELNSFVRSGDVDAIYRSVTDFAALNYSDFLTAILEVAKHYEQGCNKYGERNWEKGIPLHCYIDSGIRHLLKFSRGDNDEPHDRAFIWNMLGAAWTVKYHEELIDLPFKEG